MNFPVGDSLYLCELGTRQEMFFASNFTGEAQRNSRQYHWKEIHTSRKQATVAQSNDEDSGKRVDDIETVIKV